MLSAARNTWKIPEWQLVHISNGSTSFLDSKHSDLITMMPSAYRHVDWIEIEAKQKERAIELLQQTWLRESPEAEVQGRQVASSK
jgi:UV DNA damage endonuclease